LMSNLTLEELRDIQGIILSGYGHLSYTRYLFLHVKDMRAGRAWLREVIPSVTTSVPWNVGGGREQKPTSTLNLAFPCGGLEALGIPAPTLGLFAQEFVEGMVVRSNVLGDDGESAPQNWELGGPGTQDIHAIVILYGEDSEGMDDALAR